MSLWEPSRPVEKKKFKQHRGNFLSACHGWENRGSTPNPLYMKTKFLTIAEIEKQNLIPQMWAIYQHSFNISRETFRQSMNAFDTYALFFTKSRKLIGFSGIKDGQTQLGTQTYRTVYMGHFSVKKDFPGKSLIPFALVKLFMDHHLKFRKGKLIVWGDAGTYKSYMVMGKGTKYFFPNPNPTPNKWSSTLEALSKKVGHQCVSGIFDPERGIVHSRTHITIPEEYAITEKDLKDPLIRLYVELNPGYVDGDGLVFLCPANFANLWYFLITKGTLKKILRKMLAKTLGLKNRKGHSSTPKSTLS